MEYREGRQNGMPGLRREKGELKEELESAE